MYSVVSRVLVATGVLGALLINYTGSYASGGGNTCSDAEASSIPLPSSSTSVSICDSQMSNTIGESPCAPSSIHSRPDWLFHIKPQETGVVTITLDNISKSGGTFVNLYAYVSRGCPNTATASCEGNDQIISSTSEKKFSFEADEGEDYYILIEKTSGGNYASCVEFDITTAIRVFDPAVALSSCSNADFEVGSFADWQLTHGKSMEGYEGDATPLYREITAGENPDVTNDGHVVQTGGNDEYGNFPRVYPDGGTYSAQIGNSSVGAYAERIAQKFEVTANNASFTYHYAVVFEEPDHETYEQPFFKARLRDQDGNTVECSEFVVAAASGLPGFQLSSKQGASGDDVYYKPWGAVNVDLTNYIGEEIVAEFTVGDCTVGGHFGYAYVDASCSSSLLAENDQRTVCPGGSTTLQAPEGYQSYVWQKGEPDESTQQNLVISPTATTTYTLELTAYNGCKSTRTATVEVNDCSSCTINLPPPATSNASCPENSDGSATANPSGGSGSYTYLWADSNGQSVGTTATVEGLAVGTYSVTVTDASIANCTQTVTVPVQANSCSTPCTLSIDDIQSTLSCQSRPNGTVLATVSGGVGNYTYNWTDGNGNEVGNSATVDNLPAGLYTLELADEEGCTASGTAMVDGQNCSLCVLSAQVVVANDGACRNTATITASGGSGTYVFSASTGTLSSGANVATLQELPSGLHTVQIADANDATCTTTATVDIPTANTLLLTASSTASGCGEATGSAQVSVSGGQAPYQYSWAPTGGIEAQASGLAGGVYTVRVTDAAGCVASDTVQVEPLGLDAPNVSLGSDTVLCEGSFLVLDAFFPGGSYQWQDGNSTPTYLVNEAGTYTVTVSNGCGSQSSSITVDMIKCNVPQDEPVKVIIANALTPNGDGQNDTFYVANIEDYPDNELAIYNRWGNVVYQTRGYQNEWGGTFRGRLLPTGTYYYTLRLDRLDDRTYSGSISIFE